ncbi:hypothetical protein LEP1GSC199_2745 [Leptospira vanthielii serovar Holland str. Waz Holland = ATCC 700522]|uniref:Uncharacterized protein n=1 Tax=Leptospira vanthielii serovar Holland str. Waz Holland = ATCC 700522 TaxID=1218591 RepID=N1W6I9_9LEPT|nr:hypothetical protein LEP1GSC199_2745 [Leptospira vanthielii serovar Holland str. Waz Holland = ATCC 700522]
MIYVTILPENQSTEEREFWREKTNKQRIGEFLLIKIAYKILF